MDPQLIENSIAFAQIEDDQSDRLRHHEGLFIKALEATPATGTGFHPHALTLGNFAVMAGHNEQTFIDAVRPYIHGPRKVPDSELSDAYKKAASDLRPATTLSPNYTPQPRITPPKAFEPVIDLSSLEPAAEADLKALSPVPIPEQTTGQSMLFLSIAFQPDEHVFTGEMEIKARLGRDIKTPQEWFDGPVPVGPFVVCNPLTGEKALTGGGKPSFRCDSAVTAHRHLVVEFDTTTPEIQLAICQWFIKSGSVVSITHSGSKSYHILLKVSATDAADYKRIKAKLKPFLLAIGADRACFNPSRLTRLPGAKRPDKGDTVQRLIYLNDGAKADVDGLIEAFKGLCEPEETENEEEPEENSTLLDFVQPLDVARWAEEVPPPMKWTVPNLIPAGVVGLLSAEGGAGKSHLALLLAVQKSIASPEHIKPFGITKPGKVIYLNVEDPEDEIARRFHALVNEYKLGSKDIEMMQQNLTLLPALGLVGPMAQLNECRNPVQTKFAIGLRNLIKMIRPELLILDTKSRLFGLNENDTEHNAAWLRIFEQIAREFDCAVLVLHHYSKAGRVAGGVGASRGSSALTDNARFSLSLSAISDELAKKLNLNKRDYVQLAVESANYSKIPAPMLFERCQQGVLKYCNIANEQLKKEYSELLSLFESIFTTDDQAATENQLQRRNSTDKVDEFHEAVKDYFCESTFSEMCKESIRRFTSRGLFFGDLKEKEIPAGNRRTKTVLVRQVFTDEI